MPISERTLNLLISRARLVLSSHVCLDHGTGPCSDRQYLEELIAMAEIEMQEPSHAPES